MYVRIMQRVRLSECRRVRERVHFDCIPRVRAPRSPIISIAASTSGFGRLPIVQVTGIDYAGVWFDRFLSVRQVRLGSTAFFLRTGRAD